ncbi:predicted protein [Sclerotinia sclerotiorum 1980 UF-70]|uniref:Uncharacterized protein n=2 Tax=Sclerotinia sclerotiorum (strain ATCC 18683 / 1980 / Ss-1) TaxID=665079 RepID=A0A1D9Q3K6_SCLS1|nr:predicted protein [Sclerotinia sclerotiorum 1980 UF-70]APA09525.1 hypothetical protein sscle_05g042950 [Sclerotinia sclerotiorum 1980 UF-70]EDN96136.1 predicted protein [Sclerotinia sclerotiorum 1980 UF-70]
MAYVHQQQSNFRRHIQLIAYRSPASSQPTINKLNRPHAMHPNLQKLRIDPPVLLLLILCIIALLLWLSYGVYISVTWYIHRLRAVRYGLDENMNSDILMARLHDRSYSSEEMGKRKFGQALKWSHPPIEKGNAKVEHAGTGKAGGLSRNQSVSSGSTLVMLGDDCRRTQSFGSRGESAV